MWVWTPENRHNGRRSIPVAMCHTPKYTNTATSGVAALYCCRKAHITVSRRLYEAGLFACRPVVLCLCPQRRSECGCVGPVNIATGHQSSEATYSLRMSLDLTSRTIPEEQ
ncbi:hypothetical protein AVEN_51690-1 [Araneus ventricosus]|uniref:Uncharacterized protein n=1 Tax=Araneus ventricosus TaxID=182803 RepID=A0A4Y2HRY9_ARAVE|nr:hypothetical protein AVEN_51690-1 [Araneus ventricosus]